MKVQTKKTPTPLNHFCRSKLRNFCQDQRENNICTNKINGIGVKNACQLRDNSPFSGFTNKFQTREDKCRLKRTKTSVSTNNNVLPIVARMTVSPRKSAVVFNDKTEGEYHQQIKGEYNKTKVP